MNRNHFAAGLAFAGLVCLLMMARSSPPVLGQAAAQAPHYGEGGLPQFEEGSRLSEDSVKVEDGIRVRRGGRRAGAHLVLSRPHTLAHPRTTPPDLVSTPAPPVMEFDASGDFIQGWGGQSGPGYQWPSNEHGLHIDYKGFVWVLGNADGRSNNPANLMNDNQILKFTRDGKFVMAIGTSNQTGSNATPVLRGATRLFVYPKTNELFVSDGYGNSRIMVYDADTGSVQAHVGRLRQQAARCRTAAGARGAGKNPVGRSVGGSAAVRITRARRPDLQRRARVCRRSWKQAGPGVHARRQVHHGTVRRSRQQGWPSGEVCGVLAGFSPEVPLRGRVSRRLHPESPDPRGSWLIQHRRAARRPAGPLRSRSIKKGTSTRSRPS